MKLSWTRTFQWIGILTVLIIVIALRYEAPSDAKKTLNTPLEDRTEQGILGYWKLDDGSGTNATDSSGNGNTLAMTSSPSWVTGNIGPYALDFSGSGQYLSVADPSSGVLDFVDGADFTISGWFNRDTAAADHTIVAKKNDQTTSAGYVVWIDNNGSTDYLSAEISDGTDTYSAIGTTDLSTTGWHHFSIVWDDSKGLYIYLDGRLDGSTTSSTTSINDLSNALAFRIGAESDAGVPFDGKIDDVKLYSKALSADQVLKLYQTTVPVTPVATIGLDSGLVGHWTFDGPDVDWSNATAEIKDVSGKGNHGDASGLTTASVTPGKLGQALSFNGSGDYVDVGTMDSTQGVSAFTVSVWIYQSSLAAGAIVSNADASTPLWYIASDDTWGGNDDIVVDIPTNVIEVLAYTTSGAHSAGVWEHWMFVFDGSLSGNANRLKLYKNGAQQSLTFSSTEPATIRSGTGTVHANIGGYYNSASWNGKIDDVRIYNRALSATEVLDLYNIGR